MKRYKVARDIRVRDDFNDNSEFSIPAGTEICLEEVMDTKVKRLGHFCSYSTDCPNCKKEQEEVKEERVSSAGCSHGSGRVCQRCYKGGKLKIHTDYTNFHITEDQPKEEEWCVHGGVMCNCKYPAKKFKVQPKEEKEHKHCWDKMKELNADHSDCENCCECNKSFQSTKDQPLTPKGELAGVLSALGWMWNQYCGKNGHSFMNAGENASAILMKYGLLKDEWSEADYNKLEEFDRLYQQFLREKRDEKI